MQKLGNCGGEGDGWLARRGVNATAHDAGKGCRLTSIDGRARAREPASPRSAVPESRTAHAMTGAASSRRGTGNRRRVRRHPLYPGTAKLPESTSRPRCCATSSPAASACGRRSCTWAGCVARTGRIGAALRAAASLELLHAFALLQDDVMDESALRRGRPAGTCRVRAVAPATAGCPGRRTDSASRRRCCSATCAWCGPSRCCGRAASPPTALDRVWPRYDAMRTELAVGQFADLVNDARGFPTLDTVLDGGAPQVRQLHRAPATRDRRGDGGLRRDGAADARRIRRRDRRGVPAARRPARHLRVARGHRQAERQRSREHKATSVVVAAHHLAD